MAKVIGGKKGESYKRFKLIEPEPPARPLPRRSPAARAIVKLGHVEAPVGPRPDPWAQTGCTCGPCPANKGGDCKCGRFWYDNDRHPHCGIHDPSPWGDPTRPRRMRYTEGWKCFRRGL
jgi:hypothetical protein